LPLAFIITLSPAADYFAAILFHWYSARQRFFTDIRHAWYWCHY
jgi:hypothetical protein